MSARAEPAERIPAEGRRMDSFRGKLPVTALLVHHFSLRRLITASSTWLRRSARKWWLMHARAKMLEVNLEEEGMFSRTVCTLLETQWCPVKSGSVLPFPTGGKKKLPCYRSHSLKGKKKKKKLAAFLYLPPASSVCQTRFLCLHISRSLLCHSPTSSAWCEVISVSLEFHALNMQARREEVTAPKKLKLTDKLIY